MKDDGGSWKLWGCVCEALGFFCVGGKKKGWSGAVGVLCELGEFRDASRRTGGSERCQREGVEVGSMANYPWLVRNSKDGRFAWSGGQRSAGVWEC